MKFLICYLFLLFSFSANALSYVYGTVYIQNRLNQPLNTMSLFSSALIEANGANSSITISGKFALEFALTEASTEVSLNIPEEKLILNGTPYEIVNISCLRTITVNKASTIRLNIVVCKKGIRKVFERQLAEILFKEQLSKSVNDSSANKFVYQTASLILSNQYSTAEKASAKIKAPLDSGNYKLALEILTPFCKKAFGYLEQEKESGVIHPLLHKENVKNIQSYAYLCLLALNTKESEEVLKKLYQLDKKNIDVILGYAGILRYLEQYNTAKKILKEGQLLSLTPEEKADISTDLSRLYDLLDKQDSARLYCFQSISQLLSLETNNPNILVKLRDFNLQLAYLFEFDSCIYYYQKHLSYSRQLLKKLNTTSTDVQNGDELIDSAQVYYSMAAIYSDLHFKDSVLWALNNSSNYINSHKHIEAYDFMMKKIKFELYGEAESPKNYLIEKTQLENSLSRFSSIGNRYEKAKVLKELAKYYNYDKNPEKAQQALDEALSIFKEIGETDVMFRKLRIQISEIYKLNASIIYKKTNGDSLDTALAFYKKALKELTETNQSINETYSKEIIEISSDIMEWFNLGSMSKQLLYKKDTRLNVNKSSLDEVMKNSERIYRKNPQKYKGFAIAAFLQLASIYSTNESTIGEAKEIANKTYMLMVNHGLILNNTFNQKGYNNLISIIGYPESLFGLLANMYWLKDSANAAIETFEMAKKIDPTQALIFDLPLSRIYFQLKDYDKAFSIAERGYLKSTVLHSLEKQFVNQYLYIAARSAAALNKMDEASKYFTLLFTSNLSNYNFTEESLYEGMNFSNSIQTYANAIKFVNLAKNTPDLIMTPDVLIEQAWAFVCLNELQSAKEIFEKITTEQTSTLKSDRLVKYYSLGNIIFLGKPEVARFESFTADKLDPNVQLRYGLNKAYLAYKTNNNKASVKFLKKIKKPIENSKDEIMSAEYLMLSGLQLIQGKEIDKGKEVLIKSLAIYTKHRNKYPYQYEELKKLIGE